MGSSSSSSSSSSVSTVVVSPVVGDAVTSIFSAMDHQSGASKDDLRSDVTNATSTTRSASRSSSSSNMSRRSNRTTASLIRVLLELKDRCVKYTEYAPDIFCNAEGKGRSTNVWWFPTDFCQSRLGDRQTGSNACTLIAVILAHRIEGHDISLFGHADQSLSRHLVNALAESIVDGNEIHERLAKDGVLYDMDLTLPEALSACARCNTSFNCRTTNKRLTEWKTVFQDQEMSENGLFEDLHRGIVEWETEFRAPTPNRNLYVVIIADGRSILWVYQRTVQKVSKAIRQDKLQVTLFDSHCHQERGAVVAQVSTNRLADLCEWYVDTCSEVYGRRAGSYEVSFLYFQIENIVQISTASLCIVDT